MEVEKEAKDQLSRIKVNIGDWMTKRDRIADFRAYCNDAHIHF